MLIQEEKTETDLIFDGTDGVVIKVVTSPISVVHRVLDTVPTLDKTLRDPRIKFPYLGVFCVHIFMFIKTIAKLGIFVSSIVEFINN